MGTGLDRMSRNHIHFSPGHPGDPGVYSGRANTANIVIEIDLPACLAEGIPFYISDNRVVLSPGPIPSRLFKQAYKINTGEVIFRGSDLAASAGRDGADGSGGGGAAHLKKGRCPIEPDYGSEGGDRSNSDGGGAATAKQRRRVSFDAAANTKAATDEISGMEDALKYKEMTKSQKKNMKKRLAKKKATLEAFKGCGNGAA
jgi:hypothetical protein